MKRIAWNKGKSWNNDIKEKMSNSHKGKKQTKETISKRVKNRSWYKHSEETKKKIGKSNYKKDCKTRNKSYYERIRVLSKLEKISGRKKPYKCDICGEKSKICFDHDHKSGIFRGWICSRCNLVLGLANDNISLLNLMINYLNK